jgi:hypothetical protein
MADETQPQRRPLTLPAHDHRGQPLPGQPHPWATLAEAGHPAPRTTALRPRGAELGMAGPASDGRQESEGVAANRLPGLCEVKPQECLILDGDAEF